jgi:hypothetical protein
VGGAERTARAAFTPDELSAARARRFVRDAIREYVDGDVVDDAVLVTSELTSNALVHAGTDFEVNVIVDDFIRIEVVDGSDVLPTPRAMTPDSAGGRGLHVVGEVVRRWGAAPLASGGKSVWAELDY